MRIVFILPGRGGGGGSHSVVQEASALARMGLSVAIASTTVDQIAFRGIYPDLEELRVANLLFSTPAELAALLKGQSLAVATTAQSAIMLAEAQDALLDGEKPMSAYYIQDYEPLFFAPGSREWAAARASYSALPSALMFAKTDWLATLVEQNHGVKVARVRASLDHGIYHPNLPRSSLDLKIAAMIRPATPRRAPRRTIRVLERLAMDLGPRVQLTSFGGDVSELEALDMSLSDAIDHRGVLSRRGVADVLRDCDLFLDLSDYQAFGRTGLEAMACGCVPLLPMFGGASEFVRHRRNGYLADTRSDSEVIGLVKAYAGSGEEPRQKMRREALSTAQAYSVEAAALSEYNLMSEYLG